MTIQTIINSLYLSGSVLFAIGSLLGLILSTKGGV